MYENLTGCDSSYKNQGYWQVEDQIYPTKIQAILAAQKLNIWPTFHYNDSYWADFDWSQEPTESLEDLYLARAKQLRENYETLILRYSGGGDSYNILKTFTNNNIKLDVVVVNEYHEEENFDPMMTPAGQEHINVAYPTLKKLQSEGHKFEMLSVDISRYYMLPMHSSSWWKEINAPRLKGVEIAAPRTVLHPDLQKYNNKNTALITGLDKPLIRKIHNKIWAFQVPDTTPCEIHLRNMSMIQPEPFYWTADLPRLPCKQAHTFKNYLQSMSSTDQVDGRYLDSKYHRPLAYSLLYGRTHNMKVGDPIPYWHETTVTNSQHNGSFNPISDAWMLTSKVYDSWIDGINQADRAIDSKYKNNQGNIYKDGLYSLYTKKYWLGH
jgi:hypothetical protein